MNNHFVTRFLLLAFILFLLLPACNLRAGYWESLLQKEVNELCNKHDLPEMTAAFG